MEQIGANSGSGVGRSTRVVPLVAAAGLREVEAQVRVCQLCKLARTRTRAVPGEGNFQAEVMFIGEGPGYHEDKQGRPFVGAAGQFLNELLTIAGLSRESAYITNVVKCRPPNNRDPEPEEIAACASYLDRQIELINPRIIVTLGRYSMSRFFPGERISQIHGTARMVDGRMCVAMYHPAAGLHQASLADIIRSDFRLLPIYIEQARKMQSPSQPGQEIASSDPVIADEVPQPQVAEYTEPPAEVEKPTLVQEAPTVYNLSSETNPEAPIEPVAQSEKITSPEKASSRPKKSAQKKEEYKQISFLDM